MNKSNYKRKSTQRRTSSRAGKFKEDFKEKKDSCANDPSWYTVSGQLTKDAASISFNNPAGIQYFLNNSTNGSFVSPGVMSIYMAPTPGYSEGLSSPINIAAKNIYGWVRHANAGHTNYDSPDLILYLLAMANAYAYYGWMARIVGLLRVYSQHNRYFGANLLKACNVDADDILMHIADYRAYVNQYALKLSSLCVPTSMSVFKRYMWMFSNVFFDEDNTKAQMYMYQPAYFYIYNETSGGPGELVPKPLTFTAGGMGTITTPLTFGDLVQYGDALIGALIGSEDINIMSGDILKAYGRENLFSLDLLPEDYAIAPIFSEEVLLQIHNTVFAGVGPVNSTGTSTWDSFKVEQDPNIGNGCLICKPLVKWGGNIESMHLFDSWKADVTPDDVMVGTRNMITGMRWSQGFTAVTCFGTEIPLCAVIWNLDASGNITAQKFFDVDDKSVWDSTYTTASATMKQMSKLMYFNEHPQFYLVDYNNASPYATVDATCSAGELSNFTVLDFHDLEKMHLSAILSELAVPMLGNIVKQ